MGLAERLDTSPRSPASQESLMQSFLVFPTVVVMRSALDLR